MDLRSTPAEAAEFLNRAMGLNLSAEHVAALESRTEGWIAGLQLAAISMQGRLERGEGAVESFVRSFTGSHRYVLDYLVGEVLEQQPPSVLDFLLQTSILDRLTGPLCDAVRFGNGEPLPPDAADANGGAAILERLERANLFVVPLDEERLWYRYPHLFGELLRQRLRQTDPEQVPALHRRAGAWHEERGMPEQALQHIFAAGDVEWAARLYLPCAGRSAALNRAL